MLQEVPQDNDVNSKLSGEEAVSIVAADDEQAADNCCVLADEHLTRPATD